MSPKNKRWSSCPACRALVDPGDRACPYCNALLGARPAPERTGEERWRIAVASPVTTAMLAAIVALYLLELLVQQLVLGTPIGMGGGIFGLLAADNRTHVLFGSPIGGYVPWWVLITANFLHGGIVHIAFNAMVLLQLGPTCERILGRGRFIFLIVFSGLCSAVTAQLFTPAIGFSGALCGMLGALLVFFKRIGETEAYQQLMRTVIFIAIISFMPGISLAGHAGGFIGGALLAWLLLLPQASFFQSRRGDMTLAGLSLGGLLAAYGALGYMVFPCAVYPSASFHQFDKIIVDVENLAQNDQGGIVSQPMSTYQALRSRLATLPDQPSTWETIACDVDSGLKALLGAGADGSPPTGAARAELLGALRAAAKPWFETRSSPRWDYMIILDPQPPK